MMRVGLNAAIEQPAVSLFAWNAYPFAVIVLAFCAGAAGILVAGWRITKVADRLADRTGLGEALYGVLILGAVTSIPDTIVTVVTARAGFPGLSLGNVLGGIAFQTLFLVIADLTLRTSNLEHAAASAENMLSGALLVTLLCIPLSATVLPDLNVIGMHPASVVMLLFYGFGLTLVYRARRGPMWKPTRTRETVADVPATDGAGFTTRSLVASFVAYAVALLLSGYLVAQASEQIVIRTGINQTAIGAFLTGVTTSMPELVTAIAAVRQGAPILAVGNIVGGNTFDAILIAVADAAYPAGSIYHAAGPDAAFLIVWNQALTGLLLMGLLSREKSGWLNVGFEGILIAAVFGFGLWVVIA